MDDDNYVPKTLDAANLFLFIETDTFIVGMTFFILVSLLSIYLAVPVSWLAARYFAKQKSSGIKGRYLQILYWYTPSQYWLSSLYPSCRREYQGK